MNRTLTAIALALSLAACGPATKAPTASSNSESASTLTAEERAANTAALNVYFEEVFDAELTYSPMSQTYLGIKTDYDKWDDPSPEADAAELERQRAAVAKMKEDFDFDSLDEQGQLSWRLAEYQLERAEEAARWNDYGYTFNQMFGVQSSIPAFLINQHRITSREDAEAYIERLRGVEAYLGGHVANARRAAEAGIRPPAFVFDYVLSDAGNVITGYPFEGASPDNPSPLYEDFSKKVDTLVTSDIITEDDAEQLKFEAREALIESVFVAYSDAIQFLYDESQLATNDDGAWKLPEGGDYYNSRLKAMTTTSMTAEEIHDLGIAEVDRIHGEMRAIMEQVGFEGSLQDFFEYMRSAPEFYYPNTDEGRQRYLDEATALIDDMRTRLPEIFNTFPKADIVVKAVEPFREQSAGKAFYQRPAPDGSRPGTYYANLYRMEDMPTYQMAALAYHEGIPGHHMQLAISQELEGIPRFRKFGGYTAYSEGWGLYTELLPKEMGYYQDPYDDFGRLAMELWRAARLVVDTGIHYKKWTREEATQYLIDNTPNPEGDAKKAIDRYIVMPGQATAYKIGMNKILELRERAKAELGEAFDIRDFHDVVLRNGPVPLAILEENVDAWIAEKKG